MKEFCRTSCRSHKVGNWNTPAVAIHSTKQQHICVVSKYGFFDKNSDYVFDFIDDFYDESKTKEETPALRVAYLGNPDQKIVDAYDIYNNADGWQRDYIYYGT